jgi:aryl-alcohol dehydrogenase-like predicted oxidoreductase
MLDLVQLHCPPTEVYYEDTVFDVLEDLKDQGKIAHYGVSVEKVEEALAAIEKPGVASVQIIYNMFRLKPAQEFFEKAYKNNVGIIVRVPLASGLLCGRYDKNTKFSSGDHRNFNREGKFFDKGETFSGVPYEVGLEAVEELKKACEGDDLALYALRWILDNEFISCVIPGASRVGQIEANVSASDLPALSSEQVEMVNAVYEKYIKEHVQHLW